MRHAFSSLQALLDSGEEHSHFYVICVFSFRPKSMVLFLVFLSGPKSKQ